MPLRVAKINQACAVNVGDTLIDQPLLTVSTGRHAYQRLNIFNVRLGWQLAGSSLYDLSDSIFTSTAFDVDDFAVGKTDAISAYSTYEPFHLDQRGIRYQIYSPRSAGIDFYGDTLFTSDQELRAHPQRAEAFRAASLRGWKYAMENPEQMIDNITSRYAPGLSRDFLRFEAKAMTPLLRTDLIEVGYMNPGRWQHIADAYADLGLLPANFPLEGFLYEPETPLNWQRILPYMLAGLALLLFMGGLSAYIMRANRTLRSSVARMKRAQEIAEQALAAQRQFIAMVSHEFRSPLAVIDNAAQLLAMKFDAENDAKPILARIRRGISRLTHFLESCLTEDRLNCDGLSLHAASIDLAQLAASVKESAQLITDRHHILSEVQSGLPPMRGDSELLNILLTNLLGNAIKYSPPGSDIWLRMFQVNDGFGMEVTDQGQGIAADELPQLFDKYWRGRGAASVPGAGLGLSIAARIVELHGGSIEISSEEGVGTRILMKFPANAASSNPINFPDAHEAA